MLHVLGIKPDSPKRIRSSQTIATPVNDSMPPVDGTPIRMKMLSLVHRFTPTRRVDSWRRRRIEDKHRNKNRKIVDNYMRKIGKKSGGDLSLEHDGICCFPYKKCVFVVEVPEFESDFCIFRTKVCQLSSTSNRQQVLKAAMAWRKQKDGDNAKDEEAFRFQKCGYVAHLSVPVLVVHPNRKAFLEVFENDANLTMSVPIKGLSFDDMVECLDSFLRTAVNVNKTLDLAKR
jgi:hypothetical protein